MKRTMFAVTLTDYATNETVSETVAYASNSGVRESEALARTQARATGEPLSAGKPERDERGYRRMWTGDRTGRKYLATVKPVTA